MIFVLVITTVLAIVAMELKRTRSFLIDWLSIINLSMFAHYGLPALIESLGFSLGNPWSMFTIWPRHSMDESISMATVLACGAWLLVNLAWMATSRLTIYSMPAPRNVRVSSGVTILFISGLFGLALLGVVSRADQLGSLATALVSGSKIRSGLIVNTSEYAFLTKFGDGARAAALIAFTWLLMSKRNYRVIPLLFLIASAVLLLLVAALDASRRYLLITGVLAIICWTNFRGRLPWKFASACAAIGLAILMFGDAISLRAAGAKRDIFSGQSISQLAGRVVMDIGLPLYETAIVVERSMAEPRLIDDIPAAAIGIASTACAWNRSGTNTGQRDHRTHTATKAGQRGFDHPTEPGWLALAQRGNCRCHCRRDPLWGSCVPRRVDHPGIHTHRADRLVGVCHAWFLTRFLRTFWLHPLHCAEHV